MMAINYNIPRKIFLPSTRFFSLLKKYNIFIQQTHDANSALYQHKNVMHSGESYVEVNKQTITNHNNTNHSFEKYQTTK